MRGFIWSTELVQSMMLGMGFLLLLIVILLWVQLRKMQNKYIKMMSQTNVENFDDLIITIQNKLNVLGETCHRQEEMMKMIQTKMKTMKAKVGVFRYNAFSEIGNDLSFSIAVIDESKDGFVLTGIHNREETYIYAKPLTNGESQYKLTPEEKEAINRSN